MIRSNDFARPDYVFFTLWGTVLLLWMMFPVGFITFPDTRVILLIVGNILTGFIIYRLVRGKRAALLRDKVTLNFPDQCYLYSLARLVFIAWFFLYTINIIYSGGVVLIWRLVGDARSYTDFGMPSLAGFTMTLRNLAFVICFYLYLETRKSKYLVMPAVLLLFAVMELSRSNLLQLILYAFSVAIMRSNERISLKLIMRIFILLVIFVVIFQLFFLMRGTEGNAQLSNIFGEDAISGVPEWLFWLYAYTLTPINNVNYAVTSGGEPTYFPFSLLTTIIPSVFRIGFSSSEYPLPLVEGSFTATSAYAPMYADFGIFGAFFLMAVIQYFASVTYVLGKKGSFLSLILFPMFFSSIVLSVFYNYLFSSVALSYFGLAIIVSYQLKLHRKNSAKLLSNHQIKDSIKIPSATVG